MKKRKLIVDTTLRDGEQSPFIQFTQAEKVRIAVLLDQIGVYQIEAGASAVGLTEQNVIYEIMSRKKNARVSIWCRLNAADVKKAEECCPDVIHISIPVSYLHVYTKMGKNKSWIYKAVNSIMDIMAVSTCKLTVGFEDAARADMSFLIKILSLLEPYGTEMLRISDTVGGISPFAMRNLIRTIAKYTNIPLEVHAHNDLGMAVANSMEALKTGALFADTTLGGVGERSGNCDMMKLLRLISTRYDTGIDQEEAEEVQRIFFSMLPTYRCWA